MTCRLKLISSTPDNVVPLRAIRDSIEAARLEQRMARAAREVALDAEQERGRACDFHFVDCPSDGPWPGDCA